MYNENDRYSIQDVLKDVTINDLPEQEFENLLVNRSILLMINNYIINKGSNTEQVKIHLAKAIIGLGDYLLYKNSLYSWSYVQKSKNILHLVVNL